MAIIVAFHSIVCQMAKGFPLDITHFTLAQRPLHNLIVLTDQRQEPWTEEGVPDSTDYNDARYGYR